MKKLEDSQTPVTTRVAALKINKLHIALLVLSRHGNVVKSRAASMLFLWLSETPGVDYPGTGVMSALLGMSRFTIHRAEKQLADAGLVKFTLLTPRTRSFELLPAGEVLQSQLLAYNEIFAAPVGKRKKRAGKPDERPMNESAPAKDIEQRPGQTDEGTKDEAQPEPQTTSKTRSKLTPDDVAKICSDQRLMLAYLRFGKAGVDAPDAAHEPDNLNWERFKVTDQDPGVGQWGVQQFMGFYWWQVTAYRAQHNLALTLPPWSTLAGHLKNLLQQCSKQQLLQIIIFVVYYFDLIRWMLRRAGNTVFLDENTLTNPLVKQCANNLMGMGEVERGTMLAQMQQELQAV